MSTIIQRRHESVDHELAHAIDVCVVAGVIDEAEAQRVIAALRQEEVAK